MGNKLRDFRGFRGTMLISIIFSFFAYYFLLFYANLIRTFVSKNIFSPRIFFYSSFYFFSNSKRYFFFLNTGPRFSSQDSSTVVPTWIVDRVYTFLRNPPRFSCTGFFFFSLLSYWHFIWNVLKLRRRHSRRRYHLAPFSDFHPSVCFLFLAGCEPREHPRRANSLTIPLPLTFLPYT